MATLWPWNNAVAAINEFSGNSFERQVMPLRRREWSRAGREEFKQANGSAAFGWFWGEHDAVFAIAHGAAFNHPSPRQAGDIPPPFGQGALARFRNRHGVAILHFLRIP